MYNYFSISTQIATRFYRQMYEKVKTAQLWLFQQDYFLQMRLVSSFFLQYLFSFLDASELELSASCFREFPFFQSVFGRTCPWTPYRRLAWPFGPQTHANYYVLLDACETSTKNPDQILGSRLAKDTDYTMTASSH